MTTPLKATVLEGRYTNLYVDGTLQAQNISGSNYQGNISGGSVVSGYATVLANNQYVDVSHGLSFTPGTDGIIITPSDDLGGRYWWVDTTGSSTFRINISSVDFYDHIFGWCYI